MKTYDFSGIKVIIKFGDLHNGRFANSLQFLDDTKQFFFELVVPRIKALMVEGYKKEEIAIIFFGDLYDNKQHIDQLINSGVIDIFLELSGLAGVIISVVGNHDTKLKHDLTHSSPKSLSLIHNVHLVTEPTIYQLGPKKFGFLPWYNEAVALKAGIEVIKNAGATRGCGHNSVAGFSYEGIDVPKEGHLGVADFEGFEKFEMGHIHKEQQINNVHFVGTPYHCRSVEAGNEHVGFYVEYLEPDSKPQEFIENKISPRFKNINLFEFLEMKEKDALAYVKNSFVTVHYPYILSTAIDFTKISTVLSGFRKLDFKDYIELTNVTSRLSTEQPDKQVIFNLNELFVQYLSQVSGFKFMKQTVVLSDTQKEALSTMFQEQVNASTANQSEVVI